MTKELKTLEELLPQVLQAYETEAVEYNQLIDMVESLEKANLKLTTENKQLKDGLADANADNNSLILDLDTIVKATDKVKRDAENHMQMLAQSHREKEQLTDKLDQANKTLKAYKEIGSPKKIREQIKDYKEKAQANQKSINILKQKAKDHRRDIGKRDKAIDNLNAAVAQSSITSLYSKNGQHLLLFPAPLTMSVKGKEEKQVCLLFMDNSGTGKLIGLDEEGEPLVCKTPPGGLRVKKPTIDKAGFILRKLKKQNWKLLPSDLTLFNQE